MSIEGYMKDPRGALIPRERVKPEHLAEDELVRELAAEAEALSRALGAFRARVLGDVEAFRALIAEKYGATRGGAKGNVTLTSYDGALQLQVAIGETLSFGVELQAAKELIDGCVIRWSEGADANIRALVEHAFQTNKQGRIDTSRVLSLRRLDIDDPDWRRAMDAISDAVRVVATKSYVRFYRRDPRTEAKTPIALDIASAEAATREAA